MSERKLASIEVVTDVTPILNADAIETLTVRGWKVVSQKGNFKPGDKCVYFEIDSFLPLDNPSFKFLAERGEKTVDGVRGHVLRTVKLRGQVSQGLCIPLSEFPASWQNYPVGWDLTDALDVIKYEPPIPANLFGAVVGPFPTQFAPKTDAERVQNLTNVYDKLRAYSWYATEKIDGTSVTYINDDGVLRVCSRNLELKNNGQTQWELAEQYSILDVLSPGMVVQAEIYGEGIQGNPLGIKGQELAVFNFLWDRRVWPRSSWPDHLRRFAAPEYTGLVLGRTVDEAVEQADGINSLISPKRKAEGIVWHSLSGATFEELDGRSCFKAISNKYILKNQD